MDLTIRVNQAQFDRVMREFRFIRGGAATVICAALNRVVPGMRTDAVREVTGVYTIKAGDVRSTLKIRKASRANLEAALTSAGEAIPLAKFRVSPKRIGGRRPRGGLRVMVRRGEGGRLAHGFMAAVGGGHVGVYTRVGRSRFPIRERYGPAVPSMLKDAGALGRIEKSADARLAKEIDSQIDRLLGG